MDQLISGDRTTEGGSSCSESSSINIETQKISLESISKDPVPLGESSSTRLQPAFLQDVFNATSR